MFRRLFATLTGGARRGQDLFALSVAEAGRPDWFLAGEVPDTVNGRFAVLATVIAFITVRLERDGEMGAHASAALTERLVESLDAEIREMGVGDPTLGKQVRQLIGAVAGRVERWRPLVTSETGWVGEIKRSLYLDEPVRPDASGWSEAELRRLRLRLDAASFEELVEGRMP